MDNMFASQKAVENYQTKKHRIRPCAMSNQNDGSDQFRGPEPAWVFDLEIYLNIARTLVRTTLNNDWRTTTALTRALFADVHDTSGERGNLSQSFATRRSVVWPTRIVK